MLWVPPGSGEGIGESNLGSSSLLNDFSNALFYLFLSVNRYHKRVATRGQAMGSRGARLRRFSGAGVGAIPVGAGAGHLPTASGSHNHRWRRWN